jgi:hypothetical protein
LCSLNSTICWDTFRALGAPIDLCHYYRSLPCCPSAFLTRTMEAKDDRGTRALFLLLFSLAFSTPYALLFIKNKKEGGALQVLPFACAQVLPWLFLLPTPKRPLLLIITMTMGTVLILTSLAFELQVFILICLCLGAPFASPAFELRKRALAFAWLQLQRKRAKPGQKGKSSFRSYF